jgi:translation elongation factor EF-1alpha
MPEEKEIGKITHYYSNISVGIIALSDSLKVGDTIHIKGYSEDFTQSIDSMQIEHKGVSEAKSGDMVGIKVIQKAHPGDKVFKVIA